MSEKGLKNLGNLSKGYTTKKLCRIDNLKTGMKLGKDVVSIDSSFLLAEGTTITRAHIKHLKALKLNSVYVVDSPCFRSEQALNNFEKKYEKIMVSLKLAFEHVRIFNEVPLAQMQELVDFSINPLIETRGILEYLRKIQKQDCYTYRHSLNVAIIAGIIGKWCKYQGRELGDLILAGLLHDIGKVQVPVYILNKPGRLTDGEMQEIRKHPEYGYKLLKALAVSPKVKLAVLQHHERKDGSGYPKGRTGREICDYAAIIAVADVYDAMTTTRVYRSKQTPLLAAEVLLEQMYRQLDPYVCNTFLTYLKNSCIGASVRLSDGQSAQIIHIGQQTVCRPIVRTADGKLIDLEIQRSLDLLEFI